ncbi:MAG: hypothetical protein HY843_02440, partial [Bdellovibrio sp.]|nr:hypothetical protein [Bdellovibrio sp.]
MNIKFEFLVFCLICVSLACSSSPKVKQQAYAKLPNSAVYEYEFPVVWKGIESALKNHKITERNPEEVAPLEMKNIKERTLETDWIYSQSGDKYHEYAINNSPRKIYLQIRYKFHILAQKIMGGTEVKVNTSEEIERLKADGSPDGYEESS